MPALDPRVDDYIARSAEFARPILSHLRSLVHAACPDVEEAIKWNCPHFVYKGMLCHMAAFKEHCAFGFWKGALIVERGAGEDEKAMGQFGRITRLSDLPAKKVLLGYIQKAKELNDAGVKHPARTRSKAKPAREVVVPDDLARALEGNPLARATFDGFSPSHRREYVEWITEARTEPTRARRLESTIQWLTEGKPRNGKYTNC